MKKKQRLLVPGVTSYAALLSAIAQNVCIMGIEEPLYAQLLTTKTSLSLLQDYDLEDHPSRRFLLARKVRGENPFDPKEHEIRYLLLDMHP